MCACVCGGNELEKFNRVKGASYLWLNCIYCFFFLSSKYFFANNKAIGILISQEGCKNLLILICHVLICTVLDVVRCSFSWWMCVRWAYPSLRINSSVRGQGCIPIGTSANNSVYRIFRSWPNNTQHRMQIYSWKKFSHGITISFVRLQLCDFFQILLILVNFECFCWSLTSPGIEFLPCWKKYLDRIDWWMTRPPFLE